jgi:hypothetical protein
MDNVKNVPPSMIHIIDLIEKWNKRRNAIATDSDFDRYRSALMLLYITELEMLKDKIS